MISSYDDLRDHSKLKHVVNVSGSLPGADKMNMCTGMFDDLQCCNILFTLSSNCNVCVYSDR